MLREGFQFGRVYRTITLHMVAKTSRIELRSDPISEQRIRHAADIRRQSVSSFVLEAASARAEAVIASASVTALPAGVFDELWDALGEAGDPNEALVRVTRSKRRVEQR